MNGKLTPHRLEFDLSQPGKPLSMANAASPILPLYEAMRTTVFEEMSGLAREAGAINLGQGYPEGDEPAELIEAAARALLEQSNQYPPCAGIPRLREAIAAFYARRQGQAFDPAQILVTSGATEALACCIMALVKPGDEMILFQPAYDAYAPMIRRCGGVPVSVHLKAPDWHYEADALERAITPATKAILFNDPHNPVGRATSAGERALLADACIRHDLIAICDEVWEDVRFDGSRHVSLAAEPGMAGRAVKIGSAGKLFGLTGWKTGWICAPPDLATGLMRAHQFLTYTTPPALQWAVVEGLSLPDAWFDAQQARWGASRARLVAGLEQAGYAVLPGTATWFICVDLAASGITIGDRAFALRGIAEAGVASIPLSALWEPGPGEGEEAPRHLARLCFVKPDAAIDEAAARLADFRQALIAQ